jgi:hypothetical protein
MTQKLRIKIMHFKASMVDMCNRILGHEERMVIDILITTVNMAKETHDQFVLRGFGVRGWDEEEVRWDEVEVARVELNLSIQINDAKAEVSELRRLSK